MKILQRPLGEKGSYLSHSARNRMISSIGSSHFNGFYVYIPRLDRCLFLLRWYSWFSDRQTTCFIENSTEEGILFGGNAIYFHIKFIINDQSRSSPISNNGLFEPSREWFPMASAMNLFPSLLLDIFFIQFCIIFTLGVRKSLERPAIWRMYPSSPGRWRIG